MRKIDYNLNLEPLKIKSIGVGNLIENRIFDIITYGEFNSNQSNLYYFNVTYNSLLNKGDKNNLYFEYWNFTKSKGINYFIFSKITNEILIFDAQLTLFNKKTFKNELIDNELYIEPILNKTENKLYGLINYTGLKIFDLIKKKSQQFLYPGKKNLLLDYIISEERIIMCSSDHKLLLYDIREKNSDISRRHKWLINNIEWADNNYQNFYAYSEDETKIFLYDCRNLSQNIELIKDDIIIEKFKFNEENNNLYILEKNSEALLSIDKNRVEKIYETKDDIKTFDFNSDLKLIIILKANGSINITNINK
jgi:hypothetical protein